MKFLLKGKDVPHEANAGSLLGAMKSPKLMVLASECDAVRLVRSGRSDASVASFAAEHGARKAHLPTSTGVRLLKKK